MVIRIASRILIVGILATLWATVGSTPSSAQDLYTEGPPPEAQTAFDQGKTALEQQQYDDAVGLLNKPIRIAEEEYAEAYLLRGLAQMEMKEYQQASASFQQALQQKEELEDDQLARAHNGLGEAFLEFGQEGLGGALENFVEATQIDYKNKDYLLNVGTTLVKLRSPDQAIKRLDKVIELDDQNAEAYDARGQAHGLLAQDKPEELDLAMADFAKAVEIDPDDKTFYYNMGLVLLQNDRLEPAIGAFTQAIAKDQAQAASRADAAAQQGPPAATAPGGEPGDAPPATETTEPAAAGPVAPPTEGQTEVEPTGEDDEDEAPYIQPYMARALALTELGKKNSGEMRQKAYELAVADVDQALAMVPRMPDALLVRGVALRLMDDYDGAIASLTEALKVNPQFAEALYRRGIIWFYLGEYDLALSDLKQAGQVNPEDARPQVWQGYAHAGKGNYHEAVNAYSRALEQNERFQPALNNRGLAYMRLGQYDKAIGDFNEVIRLEPEDSSAYFKRAVAMELMHDADQAIASYLQAAQLDPDNLANYRRLAALYQQLGMADLAEQANRDADQAAARVRQAPPAQPPMPPPTGPAPAAAVPFGSELLPPPETGLFPETEQGFDVTAPELTLPGADQSSPGATPSAPQLGPATDPLTPPPPATDDSNGAAVFDLFN